MIETLRVRVPAGAAGEFPSPELTLYADSYSLSFHPALPWWHVKDPNHSAQSAGGRLHLNTHTPLTQRSRSGLTMLPRHSVEVYQGNELTRSSSGNDSHSHFSLLSQSGLIHPETWDWRARAELRLKKKAQVRNESSNIQEKKKKKKKEKPSNSQARKKPPQRCTAGEV